MDKILFYRANEIPYGVFSNFDTKHPITLKGLVWLTTEHYFQAQKFPGTQYEEQIRLAPKPRIAADMGRDREHPLRQDWETVKDDVMRDAIRAKFTQHADAREILMTTGDAELVEHTTNDSYWADGGDGSGKNMLGKILMEIRKELTDAETVV
jgi:N-glycosidase YbiA